MSKGKFALGAVIGAIGGAIAGLLFAPKSGKETRADLKVKAGEVATDVKKHAKDCCPGACDTMCDIRDKAEDIVDDVKVGASDLKHRTERAVDGAKKGFFSDK